MIKKGFCPWKVNSDEVFENGRLITVSSILISQDFFFLEFCFGEYNCMLTTIQKMEKWNENHSHRLVLSEMDDMEDSLIKMKKFYVPKFNKKSLFNQNKI